MDLHSLALALCTFFVAAFLKGTAGLGFATTCLGLMAGFLDVRLAIAMVIIPSLVSNTLVMIDAGGFRRMFRRFWLLYVSAVPGLLLGLWVLGSGATDLPRAVLGGTMLAYGTWGLWGGVMEFRDTPARNLGTGLVTGMINGLTGSQIMPIMPYLMALPISKDELVQSINTSFTLASLVMLAGMGKLGVLTWPVFLASAVGVIPVGLGIRLGSRVRHKLPEATFRKIVFVLIALLGLTLILRVVL